MTCVTALDRSSLPLERRGRLRNHAPPGDFLAAPRCGARTRADGCCRQPAMANGRCRMHGGLSTGPRTAAGRACCAAARRTHGFYAAETMALRHAATAHSRRVRSLLVALRGRATAGHGVLPSNPSSRAVGGRRTPSEGTTAATRPAASASPRLRAESPRPDRAPTAGHGVLPSFSESALDGGPARRPVAGPALGLGSRIRRLVAAGHGLLASFFRAGR